jgi:putative Mg2+ transporter-C (MgtC) family protein
MTVEEVLRTLSQNAELQALARVLLAGVIGIIVGIERNLEGKPAGARTYGMVAVGSASFTSVALLIFGTTPGAGSISAQIITGIGFLGAGTILHMRSKVVGLSTAAGMWVMAAVGMAIGYGLIILGIGTGLALFMILQFLQSGRLTAGRRDRESNGTGEEAHGQ